MKVSQNQLEDLLELAAVDRNLALARSEAKQLQNSAEVLALREILSAASVAVLNASNELETLETTLRRNQEDMDVVEQRIKRDQQRIENTTSTKDIQGLQSELQTLSRRKGELEDVVLEVMETQAGIQDRVAKAKSEREIANQNLNACIETVNQRIAKLASGAQLQAESRAQLVGRLPQELLAIYDQKASRTIPIGRLLSRECGACHLSLTASDLDHLLAEPKDDMVFCPECQAILVR